MNRPLADLAGLTEAASNACRLDAAFCAEAILMATIISQPRLSDSVAELSDRDQFHATRGARTDRRPRFRRSLERRGR